MEIASHVSVASAVSERDPRTGQFLPGNQAAADHYGRTRAGELRRALMAAVTPEDIHEVMRAMIREAVDGNAFAANIVLDRVLGKVQPAPQDVAEDTSALLHKLWREWAAPPAGVEDPAVEEAKFRVRDGGS